MSTLTCSIQYRPDLRVLVVRWLADAPVAQLQTDLEAVLAAAVAHQAGCWLLDVRRRTEQAPELAQWTVQDFYPRASAVLQPQALVVAALASPSRMGNYQHEATSRATLSYGLAEARPYRLQLFGDEGAAVQWLRS